MKLGIHAYAWTSTWSNDTLYIIDNVRNLGLDYIEIPLMRLDLFDPKAVKEKLDGFGVITSNVILSEKHDITSFDPEVRKNGVEYLKQCVKASAEAGSRMFCGVLYSQFCKPATCPPTEEEWEFSASSLREVAKYAADLGVSLAIEPCSRFMTYLINTCEQGLKLIDMIGEPNVYLHLDSHHMNIEETNWYDAVTRAGDKLANFHMCENDRGIAGTGLVNWDEIFRAFKDMGFDGNLGFEGFSDVTDNMDTWCWRKLAPYGDTFVRQNVAFARKMLAKYGL